MRRSRSSVVAYVNGRDEFLRQLEQKRGEENKEAQRRLEQQAAALKEADRRKNEFLAILAHELRNPLAPIRNAVQVLSLQDPPDPSVQWPREVIERQVQQLNRMVDDLMDVSRITQSKFHLQKEPVRGGFRHRAGGRDQPAADRCSPTSTDGRATLPSQSGWREID